MHEVTAVLSYFPNTPEIDRRSDGRLLFVGATFDDPGGPPGTVPDHGAASVGLVCSDHRHVIAEHRRLYDEVLDRSPAAVDPNH